MCNRSYESPVKCVEVLSLVPARMQGHDSVAIIVRPNPDRNFSHDNLCITRAQAERLREDLTSILETRQPIRTH